MSGSTVVRSVCWRQSLQQPMSIRQKVSLRLLHLSREVSAAGNPENVPWETEGSTQVKVFRGEGVSTLHCLQRSYAIHATGPWWSVFFSFFSCTVCTKEFRIDIYPEQEKNKRAKKKENPILSFYWLQCHSMIFSELQWPLRISDF